MEIHACFWQIFALLQSGSKLSKTIKTSARNTPEVEIGVKSRGPEIIAEEKNCLYLEILFGDFLHAPIIHVGTSNKKVSGKFIKYNFL